jgi:hypothetical protein
MIQTADSINELTVTNVQPNDTSDYLSGHRQNLRNGEAFATSSGVRTVGWRVNFVAGLGELIQFPKAREIPA